MEIKGFNHWMPDYEVQENSSSAKTKTQELPEYLASMESMKMHSLDSFLPRSCFPVSLTEDQLAETYSRTEDPWGTEMVALSEEECCWTCRAIDVWTLESVANALLSHMKTEFDNFKKDLASSNPALASTSFSFTINENNSIAIIDKSGTLSNRERSTLNEMINNRTVLKSLVMRQSGIMIQLASHFNEDSDSSLNRKNFSSRISYNDLFSNTESEKLKKFYIPSPTNKPQRILNISI
jgi:hypothetical protein